MLLTGTGPGPESRRGSDEFVAVPWESALNLVADKLRYLKDQHCLEAIFGGSYDWSSAGRLQHAKNQVHRFLNKTL